MAPGLCDLVDAAAHRLHSHARRLRAVGAGEGRRATSGHSYRTLKRDG